MWTQKIGRLPKHLEVVAHALLISIDDNQVKGASALGRTHSTQGIQGVTVEGLHGAELGPTETAAEVDHVRVQLKGDQLAISEGFRHGQRTYSTETANLQYALGLCGLDQPLQQRATVLTGGPLSAHLDLREPLLEIRGPVLFTHGSAELVHGRHLAGCRNGSSPRWRGCHGVSIRKGLHSMSTAGQSAKGSARHSRRGKMK
mmetsp:Transcript_8895/g.11098  ORF Transcript_8895/g.11098 Transcript_8895/m.11098 type:complete len:202 (+) Transcript_8895:191-796(+)